MTNIDIKLYRGYGNQNNLVVFGHVVEKYPHGENQYTHKGFKYARTIIKLFSVKTIANITVCLKVGNSKFYTQTENDGYFRFSVTLPHSIPPGWSQYQVEVQGKFGKEDFLIARQEEFFIPYTSSFGIISDIDDTFLISHSRKSFKKLFLLLSKNVQSRKPFQDVVQHYQLLSFASHDRPQTDHNIFFYVSSSEWNLYDMIVNFAKLNGLPKAILKLKKIKSGLDDFISTGSGSHDHKLKKIFNIIQFYPDLQFILLGDDSQKDPDIYQRVCTNFPQNIKAVYIRRTRKYRKKSVIQLMENIRQNGVETCYFDHSSKAIQHSLALGIVFSSPAQSTDS
ncbi:phosphatidate phosphatase APP1 [Dyadobacter jejuensis]|uniref:Phosphatidate phosphatase APP1 n=1 Tax=Dyadobacter jejuensis TaxID=1082580 RepID=A0A316AP10_9BACT|nr:phosphatase domain-containing protein [Dyadobacter jejuensis]PWJ59231.1 phosphatidate phosphatase APP1 [Dyadobacter jejuensis]